jgi:hypothetical protein
MQNTTNQSRPSERGGDEEELNEILNRLKVTPEFGARCELAANTAFRITKMRQSYGQRGFFPVAVGLYLQRLSGLSIEELSTVLGRFGLQWPILVSRENSIGIGALLREIGMVKDEALTLVRITFLEQHGTPFSMPTAIAYRGSALSATEQRLRMEEALIDVESEATDERKAELIQIVTGVGTGFDVP